MERLPELLAREPRQATLGPMLRRPRVDRVPAAGAGNGGAAGFDGSPPRTGVD
jgi:hypothetical protein